MNLSTLASLILYHQGKLKVPEAEFWYPPTFNSSIEWSVVSYKSYRGSQLVVVIPGTNDWPDIVKDFRFLLRGFNPNNPGSNYLGYYGSGTPMPIGEPRPHYPLYDRLVTAPELGLTPKQKIHAGFRRGYSTIADELQTVMSDQETLNIVGHSLGAAVGLIAAFDFSHNFHKQVNLVTLGSPRVGNPEFVEICDEKVPSHKRLVHGTDPIPTHPLPFFGYKHSGKEDHFGEGNPHLFNLSMKDHRATSYHTVLSQLKK